MKKSFMFNIRMTPLEYAVLKDKCKKSGITVSEFTRVALQEKNVIMVEGIPEMVIALNRIGNNINQIARAVNYGLLMGVETDIKKAALELKSMKNELLQISRKVDICR